MASQVSDILNKLTFCPVPDDWVRLEEHCQIESLVLKMWTPWIAFANATICSCLTNTLGSIHYILKRQIKWLKCWLRCLGLFMADTHDPCYSTYCGFRPGPPPEHYLTMSIYSIIAQSMPMLRDRSMIPYLSQEGFKRKLPAKQCGDLIFNVLSWGSNHSTCKQCSGLLMLLRQLAAWVVWEQPPFGNNLSFPPRLWELRFG